jgi:predicted GTPase
MWIQCESRELDSNPPSLMNFLKYFKSLWDKDESEATLKAKLEELRQRTPTPVIWLFGKTQSGKTSIVRFLTGADDAEIGQGFRPTTRYSREYHFPTADTPLLSFLDTRGLGEPGYDAAEDIAQFDQKAHVVLVTIKVMDHAQAEVIEQLRKIHAARPDRPIVLVPTCLHEADPQAQHVQPYPFAKPVLDAPLPENLVRSLEEQKRRFAGLYTHCVPIDLTRPEEGYTDPNYGGEYLKQVLIEVLPEAYRQTLVTLDAATGELRDLYERRATPHILSYAMLATSAGAFPIPGVDVVVLPAIQLRMINYLATLYGRPMTAQGFMELAASLGLGMLTRQLARSMMKFIPGVGSVVAAAPCLRVYLRTGQSVLLLLQCRSPRTCPQGRDAAGVLRGATGQGGSILAERVSRAGRAGRAKEGERAAYSAAVRWQAYPVGGA